MFVGGFSVRENKNDVGYLNYTQTCTLALWGIFTGLKVTNHSAPLSESGGWKIEL